MHSIQTGKDGWEGYGMDMVWMGDRYGDMDMGIWIWGYGYGDWYFTVACG